MPNGGSSSNRGEYSRGRGSSRPRPDYGWTDRTQSDTKALKNEAKGIVYKVAQAQKELLWYETKYRHTESAATAWQHFENVHWHRGELRRALIRLNQLMEENSWVMIKDNWLCINTDPLKRCLYEHIPKFADEQHITLNFQGLKHLWDKTEGCWEEYDEPHIRFAGEITWTPYETFDPPSGALREPLVYERRLLGKHTGLRKSTIPPFVWPTG